ncbi:MAG: glycosyltransferase family 4 protein [Desulfobacterales bacterium]
MTCYELPPVGGGGGRFAATLASELAARGDKVDLVTMGFSGLPRLEQDDLLRIHRTSSIRMNPRSCRVSEAAFYLLCAIPMITKLCSRYRYQLVHSHFILPDGLLGLWAQQVFKTPFIVTAHGTDVPHHNPHRARRLHSWLYPLWWRLTLKAAVVVCPSRYLKARVLNTNRRANTTVIPNGFDPSRFQPVRPKCRRVLVVTRMVEFKGVQFLLRALHGVHVDHEVVIVGDGPYAGDLQRYAAELTVPVRFTGWLDNNSVELKDLYETSDIFVFPSETENCPVVLLEAMAAGLAIITTRNTGCAELVGDAAILVAPHDAPAIRAALMELVSCPKLIETLGKAARARLESTYSWQVIAHRYREIYSRYARCL